MVAGIVGLLVLLLLFFFVRACNNTRHEDALKRLQPPGLRRSATESRQTGESFFKQMDSAGSTSPTELYQSILSFKGAADQSLKQAQDARASPATWRPPTSRC